MYEVTASATWKHFDLAQGLAVLQYIELVVCGYVHIAQHVTHCLKSSYYVALQDDKQRASQPTTSTFQYKYIGGFSTQR